MASCVMCRALSTTAVVLSAMRAPIDTEFQADAVAVNTFGTMFPVVDD